MGSSIPCSKLMKPVRRIENRLENTIRELNLPLEERKKKQTDDMAKIQSFEVALRQCQKKLNEEINRHVLAIYDHLKSGLGRQVALSNWTLAEFELSEVEQLSGGKQGPSIRDLLEPRVKDAVSKYERFAELVTWADSREVKDELEDIVARYTSLQFELNRYDDTSKEESTGVVGRVARMLAVGIPSTVLCLAVAPLTIVVGSFWLLQIYYSKHKMQSSLQQEYDKFVSDLEERNHSKLREFVTGCAAVLSDSMYYVYKSIPKEITNLKEELETRLKREQKKHLPEYTRIYDACQPVKESLSSYMADSGIHEFHENDLLWPHSSPVMAGFGASSYVYQAQIMGPGGSGTPATDVAVKVLHPNSEGLFSAFLKEREECRYCMNTRVRTNVYT